MPRQPAIEEKQAWPQIARWIQAGHREGADQRNDYRHREPDGRGGQDLRASGIAIIGRAKDNENENCGSDQFGTEGAPGVIVARASSVNAFPPGLGKYSPKTIAVASLPAAPRVMPCFASYPAIAPLKMEKARPPPRTRRSSAPRCKAPPA